MARQVKVGELMVVNAPNLWRAWHLLYPEEAQQRGIKPPAIRTWLQKGTLDRARHLDAVWDADGNLDPVFDGPNAARDFPYAAKRKNCWYTMPESGAAAVHSTVPAIANSGVHRAAIMRGEAPRARSEPSPLVRNLGEEVPPALPAGPISFPWSTKEKD